MVALIVVLDVERVVKVVVALGLLLLSLIDVVEVQWRR